MNKNGKSKNIILVLGIFILIALFFLLRVVKHRQPRMKTVERPRPAQTVKKPPEMQVQADKKAPEPEIIAAIVIDDLGYNLEADSRFALSHVDITLSVMPLARFSAGLAERARSAGKDVLLHVPMEPETPTRRLGEGALTTQMSDSEIIEVLDRDLATTGLISGVNNHMGSKFTEDLGRMTTVLSHLKGRGLFFLDSRTTANTAGREAAEKSGARFVERDVFLDNELGAEQISEQLEKLKKKARSKGYAVGIGHPHIQTLEAIEAAAEDFMKEGIRITGINRVIGRKYEMEER